MAVKTKPAGAAGLPAKFTADERYGYQWLEDCQIRGWLVDYKDKSVIWADKYDRVHRFNSLVSLAEFFGLERKG